jgi:RNA polymerase sigma-70 factor (ECF subfamily)
VGIKYSEQELLQGCLKQKPEMQRALYQKFARTMLGICIRYTKDKMEAEDILQQGFMKVFTYLESFKGGSLEGWMKRIFVRESIDQYRKNQKNVFSFTQEPEDHHSIELDDVVGQLSAEEIVNLIAELPEGCRMVFNLYAVEGYNHREIGELIGISDNTSKSQYARAKEILKEKIYARENG